MSSNSKPEYLNKDLSAKRSGLSVRRLLELANKGAIRKKHMRDPQSKRQIAVFAAEDLDRLNSGEYPQTGVALTTRKVSGAALSQPSPHPSAREIPWLTLAEAAEFSGLPESFLLSLVTAGRLPALDVGVRPGGRYRVSRRDIGAIEGDRMARPISDLRT